ncbi:MAG: Na+/H+ antiporter subunit B [Verrucomicrobiales bacterium]
MRPSILLQAATQLIFPLQLGLSVFLLLRGHNLPGGGFIGGLVAASAFVLYGLTYGLTAAQTRLWVRPEKLIALGLIVAGLSMVPAMLINLPAMQALWLPFSIPTAVVDDLKLGTPLVFDIGVYLTVIGSAIIMVFSLQEEE